MRRSLLHSLFALIVGLQARAQSVITTVATVPSPHAIIVNPTSNKIYVAGGGSDGGVTVIDGVTSATTTLQVPVGWEFAVNPVTNKVYLLLEYPYNVGSNFSQMEVIDGVTNATKMVKVGSGGTAGIAINTTTNQICVSNFSSETITLIDGVTEVGSTVGVGNGPVAVNPVTNKFYASDSPPQLYQSGSLPSLIKPFSTLPNVSVIDGATRSTSTVYLVSMATDIAVNPATNKIYTATSPNSTVTIIDGETNATTTVPCGIYPTGIAINTVTNKIYVVNIGSASAPMITVTVIDGVTNRTTTIPIGPTPMTDYLPAWPAIAVNSATNKIYVTNFYSDNVTVIDGVTNATDTIPVGNRPRAIAVNSATNKIYVANEGDNSVTIIDGNAPLASPSISIQPQSQTISTGASVVFTASASSATTVSYSWLFNGTPLSDGGGVWAL